MTRRVTAAIFMVLAAVMTATAVRAAEPKEIPITIENNRFSPEEIKVKAGEPFVLVVTNKDKAPEEFESKDLRIEKTLPLLADKAPRGGVTIYLCRDFACQEPIVGAEGLGSALA